MIEFEVSGVKRGFKLGTYTFKLINELAGTKTVEDVFNKLKTQDEGFTCVFYFCCAKHYAMSKKIEVDFQEVDVADWMDDLGLEKILEISTQLFKTYITKNQPAPTTGQSAQ
jgi:hypothetical protein